jgi:hypothetical protein
VKAMDMLMHTLLAHNDMSIVGIVSKIKTNIIDYLANL